MDEGQHLETMPSNGDHYGDDVTSWVSVCPRGLWKVQQKPSQQTSSGEDASTCYHPKLGSLCRVRVRLSAESAEANGSEPEEEEENLNVAGVTDETATVFPRCQDSVLQVPLGNWTTLRLGEGQCDITEACVERMRAGEKCEILISPLGKGPGASVAHPPQETLPVCATVELKSFTQGKESWEMSPAEKWEWVKCHKERGGVRFRSGDVWGAADSYSRALKPHLITLCGLVREENKTALQGAEQRITNTADQTKHLPPENEMKITKAELHSNLSLCQLKLNQPERARASAAKATQLDPSGAKAWYRLGQACQMVNELEEAKRAFRKLLELQPDSPAALKALRDIANKEKETNVQLGLRLSKMFS